AFAVRGGEPAHAALTIRATDSLPFPSPIAAAAASARGSERLLKVRGVMVRLDLASGRATALCERGQPGQDLQNLMRILLAAFGPPRGLFLLHAAAVESGGGAVLLVGAAQAGKSTAAALASPRPVLTDDVVALRLESGRARVD